MDVQCLAHPFELECTLLVCPAQVEPEAVSKLPGAPNNGTLEVTMVLATGKRQVRVRFLGWGGG